MPSLMTNAFLSVYFGKVAGFLDDVVPDVYHIYYSTWCTVMMSTSIFSLFLLQPIDPWVSKANPAHVIAVTLLFAHTQQGRPSPCCC